MRSNYKKLGPYIKEVSVKNTGLIVNKLLGVSITKQFIPSIANTIGTDMSKYKIVRTNQFAYGPVTSRNGDKISVALLQEKDCIISTSYTVFEIIDPKELLPEYLMMWLRRPEFDRYARYMSHGSVREIFGWDEMCDVELPVPSPEKQREIIKEYNTIVDRIKLNEQLNDKLEETAQAIYKQWFVDSLGDELAYKETVLDAFIEFNPKHSIKKAALTKYVEMSDLHEDSLSIKHVRNRPFTAGSKFINHDTLLARITPCLENGKTAFVDCLDDAEVAYGSTEFIVMRSRNGVSPYWTYCLARDDNFRSYAISSMVGSSGRQRVHTDYLKVYKLPKIDPENMKRFHAIAQLLFKRIREKSIENKHLDSMKELLLLSIVSKS